MSLDTLLEAAKYLEKIEQNGDIIRSGSSCSGSLSSGGDRSPGGYLRLDPNLPISSQFHDYSFPIANNFDAGSSTPNRGRPPNDKGHVRSRKQTHVLVSPGSYGGESRNGYLNSYYEGHSLNKSPGVIVFPKSATQSSTATLSPSSAGGIAQIAQHAQNARGKGTKLHDPEASSRHRELHKTLEKNRRAHLRHCFEELRKELPTSEYSYKKSSHINIIHSAIRYINYLKKAEWENEHEIERLARIKIRYQQQLTQAREQLHGTSVLKSPTSEKVESKGRGKDPVQELIGAILKQAESKAVKSFEQPKKKSPKQSFDDFDYEERQLMIEDEDDEDTESEYSVQGTKSSRQRLDSCMSGCFNSTSMDSMMMVDDEDDDGTSTASEETDGISSSPEKSSHGNFPSSATLTLNHCHA